MKTFIYTIPILMLLALILVPAEKLNSAEIKDVRFSSEPEKTRVVFELDESTQYKSQYDENNITVNISKAKLNESSKSFELKNGLVKDLFLKQSDDDTNARISLEKTAKYKIFTLGSPERIVIDISPTELTTANASIITPIKPAKPTKPVEKVPVENLIEPEVVEITPNEIETGPEPASDGKGVETASPEVTTPAQIEESNEEIPTDLSISESETQLGFKLPEINYHLLFLYAFDLMVLIVIISMGLRVRTTYRFFKYIKTLVSSQNKEPVLSAISDTIREEKIEAEKDIKNELESISIREKIEKMTPKRPVVETNGKRKVLVIDNKEVTYNLTYLVSQAHGYETIYANNNEEGLIKALGENPDLILLDSSSSTINADELCAKLKADKDTRKISIIMLLGEGTSEAILRSRELGADDYLVKPFTRRQLLEKMNKFLEGGKGRRIFKFLDGLLYQS
ncbi:MAG: response regulator [Candidatus Poribacteria bacterium]